MQARAADGVLVVEYSTLVLEKHVDYSRMTIPTGDFERNPLLPPLDIGINMLLDEQVINNRFISHRASDVQG
jgi:hypothetical protein